MWSLFKSSSEVKETSSKAAVAVSESNLQERTEEHDDQTIVEKIIIEENKKRNSVESVEEEEESCKVEETSKEESKKLKENMKNEDTASFGNDEKICNLNICDVDHKENKNMRQSQIAKSAPIESKVQKEFYTRKKKNFENLSKRISTSYSQINIHKNKKIFYFKENDHEKKVKTRFLKSKSLKNLEKISILADEIKSLILSNDLSSSEYPSAMSFDISSVAKSSFPTNLTPDRYFSSSSSSSSSLSSISPSHTTSTSVSLPHSCSCCLSMKAQLSNLLVALEDFSTSLTNEKLFFDHFGVKKQNKNKQKKPRTKFYHWKSLESSEAKINNDEGKEKEKKKMKKVDKYKLDAIDVNVLNKQNNLLIKKKSKNIKSDKPIECNTNHLNNNTHAVKEKNNMNAQNGLSASNKINDNPSFSLKKYVKNKSNKFFNKRSVEIKGRDKLSMRWVESTNIGMTNSKMFRKVKLNQTKNFCENIISDGAYENKENIKFLLRTAENIEDMINAVKAAERAGLTYEASLGQKKLKKMQNSDYNFNF